nr:polyprenyl synthetase family protein [Streptomyces atroolivaceus]
MACRVGAMQANRESGRQDSRQEDREEALAGFGWQFGYAYQLRDDILDLTSTAEELGKPVNTDLSEGVYTLPVIRAASRDRDLGRLLGRFTGIDQASISTVHLWFKRLRVFATWLRHRGIDRLYEVNDRDLDLYLDHVRSIQANTGTRRQLFSAVRAVWAYAPYLPPECRMPVAEPWQGRSPGELTEDIQTGRGNKTARIAVDTMIPLLDWAPADR